MDKFIKRKYDSRKNNIHEIIPIITQYLELLEEKITKYFPVFNVFLDTKSIFYNKYINLWVEVWNNYWSILDFFYSEFKNISEKAITINCITIFNIILYEHGFSTLTNIKTKTF